MRRFKLRPELRSAFIPGFGSAANNSVLEGDQFAKFVPALLVEVPEAAVVSPPAVKAPPAAPAKALPVPLVEPVVSPAPLPEPKPAVVEEIKELVEETKPVEKPVEEKRSGKRGKRWER
jgi:hypothetical protein